MTAVREILLNLERPSISFAVLRRARGVNVRPPSTEGAEIVDAERRRQVAKELFQAIIDLPPEGRSAYLDEHCPDAEIRAEVESLLIHLDDPTPGSFLGPLPSGSENVLSDEETLPSGFTIDEFKILRAIGTGGMGVVYLAEDTILRRSVALKVLSARQSLQPSRVLRFEREAKAVAGLKHPNIVAIYRVGQASGLYFIAMEFIDGKTLAGEIARRRARSADPGTRTRLEDVRDVARLIASVADALDHAHQNKIIHRDVKPSNILIGPDGEPRLADFGIAKNLEDDTITMPGIVPGTYRYMSPEQAAALAAKIDARSDIFSLGSVLYEALTLSPPFEGNTREDILQQIISRIPSWPRSVTRTVPADVDTICRKAMEKDPRDRYPTAGHLAADLRAFLNGDPIMARRASVVRRTRRWVRRHRVPSMAAAILLLLGTIAAMVYRNMQQTRARLCPVTITCDHPGTKAFVQEFDRVTLQLGDRVPLGDLPLIAPADTRPVPVHDRRSEWRLRRAHRVPADA